MKQKQKMEVFDCLVSLGNNENDMVTMTVPKKRISGMEVRLLREIHGHGAIKAQTSVGTDERDLDEEKMRLVRFYGGEVGSNHFNRAVKHLDVDPVAYENWLADALEAEEQERNERSAQRAENERRRQADLMRAALKPQEAA